MSGRRKEKERAKRVIDTETERDTEIERHKLRDTREAERHIENERGTETET